MNNICSVCKEEFEDKYFDKEQNKCILHCKKDDNLDYNLFYEKLNIDIEYHKKRISDHKKALINDPKMSLNKEWVIDLTDIHFPNNTYNLFYFDDFREYNLYFDNCTFNCEVSEILHNFKKQLSFINCKFKNDVKFNNCIFSQSISFRGSTFSKNLILENTIFEEIVSFKNSTFKNSFSIDETIFKKEVNYMYINLNRGIKNRETARIIKNSFEQINNIIESNKYYAIEMELRRRELKKEDNFAEKTVLTLHNLSSSYSQDWTKALFWILLLSISITFFKEIIVNGIDETININMLSYFILLPFIIFVLILLGMKVKSNRYYYLSIGVYFLYSFLTFDLYLVKVLSFINPFIDSNIKETNILSMLFRIIIAYLIYQFIISIRQNTRRK